MDDREQAQDAALHASISSEPEVLYGPWDALDKADPMELRLVRRGDAVWTELRYPGAERWYHAKADFSAAAISHELTRLAQETKEAERFKTLAARMYDVIARQRVGSLRTVALDELAMALLMDEDAKVAVAWLQAQEGGASPAPTPGE